MKYKILTHTQGYLFLELSDEICKLMKNHQKTPYDLEFELFLQIPNLTKVDILEYFEESILDLATGYSGNDIELDSLFFEFLFDSTNVTAGNSTNPTYISEYINIVGQLFLAGYIDFGLCGLQDKEENLLSRQKDTYQAWIHFRDNFFYTDAFYRDYEILDDSEDFSTEEYGKADWDMPKYWDRYTFWVTRTQKGTQYFNEILAPRFYNKYKDLEVEIDSKGNVIRWIGRINR
ncbi:hypothetical protein CNT09_07270 [Campylobacter coli]|uniref:hypothetical protein n=2 Tax=Helicobacter pullorum TaxID=35818 RepID=UPI0008169532|nr:hypothetical protein [Helicobacter pullorum]EAI7507084.1 hypothetical protein [Campylobacter coli]EAK6385914.1 hypothetical protein [Campylobacter coli]EGD0127164.1 hypothetical protein [Campylobacter coli]OCR06755.1 hypothetical protein A7X13_09330 [Helicobacter pullorum]